MRSRASSAGFGSHPSTSRSPTATDRPDYAHGSHPLCTRSWEAPIGTRSSPIDARAPATGCVEGRPRAPHPVTDGRRSKGSTVWLQQAAEAAQRSTRRPVRPQAGTQPAQAVGSDRATGRSAGDRSVAGRVYLPLSCRWNDRSLAPDPATSGAHPTGSSGKSPRPSPRSRRSGPRYWHDRCAPGRTPPAPGIGELVPTDLGAPELYLNRERRISTSVGVCSTRRRTTEFRCSSA